MHPTPAPAPAPASATEAAGATVSVAGERVVLSAQRALYWPRERTLFVADVHLGKAAAFRAGGVPVPRGSTRADLDRLSALVAAHGAARLVVLGDFIHAAAGRVPALDIAFRAWRGTQPTLDLLVVRGNHDEHAGDPPPAWGIEVVAAPHLAAPFLLCHEPHEPPTGYALCGHVHPGVRIAGAGDSARLPCFVFGRRRALLPAFGRMTGLALVRPGRGEQVVAIAGPKLFALPAA